MYKLLIVDDEDIEREGMAGFIPWEEHGITLVGSAWNGVEGYEEIQNQTPDIVITDIKMPVMNGIELIKKTKKDYPDIIFIVLSGYGEYEYTSRAMELGVRHYILKPCDESKILDVIGKVKEEIRKREEERKREYAMRSQVKRMEPRAREQMFRNVLLNREDIHKDFETYLEEVGKAGTDIFLLAFHRDMSFDYLEQFVVTNILSELLGNGHILLTTAIRSDILFLLDSAIHEEIQPVINKVLREYEKFDSSSIQTVFSGIAGWEEVHRLYEEVAGLLKMMDGGQELDKLKNDFHKDVRCDELFLVNYRAIKAAKVYDRVLFEFYLGLVKMRLRGDSDAQIGRAFLYTLNVTDETRDHDAWLKENVEGGWNGFLKKIADYICDIMGIDGPGDKEEKRMREILAGIYENIRRPELNIQWLTKEILYMNEDYFGRIFSKAMNQKYSSYVLTVRIELAKRLIWYFPDIKISQIAEEVGYPPDGQYFSRTFRKLTGMTPSEYREYTQKQV